MSIKRIPTDKYCREVMKTVNFRYILVTFIIMSCRSKLYGDYDPTRTASENNLGVHAFHVPEQNVVRSRRAKQLNILLKHPKQQHLIFPKQEENFHTTIYTNFRQTTFRLYNTRGGDVVKYYEDFQRDIPSKNVLDAIDQVIVKSTNGQVIASDVASTAGISLQQAKRSLTVLATVCSGDVAVNADGELIYTFPTGGIQSALSSNSQKYRIREIVRKFWPGIFWGVRVSFGISLLVSLAVVFSAILFLQTSSSSSSDDRDDRRRGGGGGSPFSFGGMYWGPTPFDFFYYRPYGYYSKNNAYDKYENDNDEMGFLESIFSYVFGDGNPNENITEKRLASVSTMIRNNNGAVTAEQLAPYCDETIPDPKSVLESNSYVDESYVLPIVSALNGEPQVTDNGDIVYIFPDLLLSANDKTNDKQKQDIVRDKQVVEQQVLESFTLQRAGLSINSSSKQIIQFLNYNGIGTRGIVDRTDLIKVLIQCLPPVSTREQIQYDKMVKEQQQQSSSISSLSTTSGTTGLIQERTWKFTLAPNINKLLAGGLGAVNLIGAVYLGNILGQYITAYSVAGVMVPPALITLSTIYPFLVVYAILYNTIPLVRNIWIQSENSKIEIRNERRIKWNSILADTYLSIKGKSTTAPSQLVRKLLAATSMQQSIKRITDTKIIYNTKDTTIEKLSQQKQVSDLDEFDKKLNS